MKIHEIDNSLNNLGKAVLWQYDRAVRLLSVLKHMQVLYHCAVEQFWDFWTNKVLAIDTCGAFGCSVWGIFLGVPRPTVKDENGKDRLIATSVYRKILKGTFYLMKATSSFDSILGYLEVIFGIGGDENLSKWSVSVSEYGWTTNIDDLNDIYKSGVAYSKGDIFSYDRMGDGTLTNWKCLKDISKEENTSFEAIADYVTATNEPTNGMAADETLLLKLYDPEGICRKIGGAPNNSLSISVEYEFGETTIKAEATRRRKCGVTLTDNQDLSMEYGKSEYYDEMHRDQKAIFEQRMMDFCPFPLGIKTNAPIPEVVFGFTGQENAPYQSRKEYAKGEIFGYIASDGTPYNYECTEHISSPENTSFEAIADKVKKTKNGNPFIGGFVDFIKPYDDLSTVIFAPNILVVNTAMSYAALAAIVGEFNISTYGNTISSSCCCACFPLNKLFVGRNRGINRIYRLSKGKLGSNIGSYEAISDGENYIACFIDNWLFILTRRCFEVAPNPDSVFYTLSGSNSRTPYLGLGWKELLGFDDALGDVAEKTGMMSYPLVEVKKPIPGVSYRNTTGFSLEGKRVVQTGESEYRPIGTTTIISSSSL